MQILGAPNDLVAVVLVTTDGPEYTMQVINLAHEAIPITRRAMAKGLRELAEAVDAQADAIGDD